MIGDNKLIGVADTIGSGARATEAEAGTVGGEALAEQGQGVERALIVQVQELATESEASAVGFAAESKGTGIDCEIAAGGHGHAAIGAAGRCRVLFIGRRDLPQPVHATL
ncbi:MAG: hypothetical protein B7W97_00610 [Mycobacterium sp. 20-66-4]|nr:MAG: hypothetical protein B7W97_00610 [Mycobacterium sp. 20-66-4]